MRFSLRFLQVLLLLGTASGTAAQTPSCVETLRGAEVTYEEGNFGETVRRLTPCLGSDQFDREQTIRAHRLLSMAHANNGDAQGARLALHNLLRRFPDYEPDPIQDPPSYVVLVSVIKDQLQAESGAAPAARPSDVSWTRKPGTWIGLAGGFLVVGLAALLAGEGAR